MVMGISSIRSGTLVGIVNMVTTLLGGGGALIPLTLRVRQSGLLGGPALLTLTAGWSYYSSWTLIRTISLIQVGTEVASYGELARHTLGSIGARTVQLVIVANALFISTALLGLFAETMDASYGSRSLKVTIGGLVTFPAVAFIRNIEHLVPVSFFLPVAVAVFIGFMIDRALCGQLDIPSSDITVGPADWPSVPLHALGSVVLAFCCQYNVLPIYRTLHGETAEKRTRTLYDVLFFSTIIVLFIYCFMDVVSYMTFGLKTYDAMLVRYRDMRQGRWGVDILAIGQLASLPICAHCGVMEVAELMRASLVQQAFDQVAGPKSEASRLLSQGGDSAAADASRAAGIHAVAGTLFVGASISIAIAIPDNIEKFLPVFGAACAMPLMAIFPPLMLLLHYRTEGGRTRGERFAEVVHGTMVIVGCVVCITCLAVSIVDYNAPSPLEVDGVAYGPLPDAPPPSPPPPSPPLPALNHTFPALHTV